MLLIITTEQHVLLGKQGHMVTFISGDLCQTVSPGEVGCQLDLQWE